MITNNCNEGDSTTKLMRNVLTKNKIEKDISKKSHQNPLSQTDVKLSLFFLSYLVPIVNPENCKTLLWAKIHSNHFYFVMWKNFPFYFYHGFVLWEYLSLVLGSCFVNVHTISWFAVFFFFSINKIQSINSISILNFSRFYNKIRYENLWKRKKNRLS